MTASTTPRDTSDARFIVIDSIFISGNEQTQEDIILKELPFTPGDTIVNSQLHYFEERVFSLGIFNNVSMRIMTPSGKNILHIHVVESWYIYPLPFIDFKENDWSKISYGMNILIKNFRGRNEDLSFSFGLGYDPFYSATYVMPYLIRSQNISLYFFSEYATVSNKSPQAEAITGGKFDNEQFTFNIGLGKRFDIYNKGEVFASYKRLTSPFSIRGITASGTGTDVVPAVAFQYTHDSRDLKQFPDRGIFFTFLSSYYGFNIDDISYNSLNSDFRFYFPVVSSFTGKVKFSTQQRFGKNIPFYNYAYLGLADEVRGHRTERVEGKKSYFGSFEVKYPLIPMFDLILDLPLIPRQLQQAKTALYLTLFADAGFVQNDGNPVTWASVYSGYGVGIAIPALPFNLGRIEYAFNKFGKGELIIDLGLSF